MEVAIESRIPIDRRGLGVPAGDTLRRAAAPVLPAAGVTRLHRVGHVFQHLDEEGRQREDPVRWSPDDRLAPEDGACRAAVLGVEGVRMLRGCEAPGRGEAELDGG